MHFSRTFFLIYTSYICSSNLKLFIDPSQLEPVAYVSDKFISVAIDSHVVAERWKNFDFHSKKVLAMATALAPAYLRLGGTAADLLIFDPHGNTKSWTEKESQSKRGWCAVTKNETLANEDLDKLYKKREKFIMSGEDFENLYNFTSSVGWTLLFDLNVLNRKGRSWDPSNAKEIMRFASKRAYSQISWELGNEPNSLKHHLNVSLPSRQLGKDFWALKRLLKKFPLFRNSTLVGPDVNGIRKCSPRKHKCKGLEYLKGVIASSGNVLDAVTWHQYYWDGHKATEK